MESKKDDSCRIQEPSYTFGCLATPFLFVFDKGFRLEVHVGGNKYITNNSIDRLIQEMAAFGATNEGIIWEKAQLNRKNEVNNILASYYVNK